jgi:hypothetical protein
MELCSPPSSILHRRRRRRRIRENREGGGRPADPASAPPVPTRAVYDMVLRAYAKERGPVRVARQAEDVIWSMISRANAIREGGRRRGGGGGGGGGGRRRRRNDDHDHDHDHDDDDDAAGEEESGDDDVLLLPTSDNWNCVLRCWSRSTDPDRAFFAYSFLLSWMEWNDKWCAGAMGAAKRGVGREGGCAAASASPGEESFRWVLRSCLVGDDDVYNDDDDAVGPESSRGTKDEGSEFRRRRAKEMGSGVAVRLWREMHRNHHPHSGEAATTSTRYDSTTHRDVMRAICQTSEMPTASRALATLVRVYSRCAEDGMLTPDIMALVESATTKAQFARLRAKADGR